MNSRSPRRRLMAVSLACLLVVGGCGADAGSHVPTVKVGRQKFARVVEADGFLRPVRATPVTVPADVQWPLRITWLAPDGAVVKKGEPLARFDDLELKERLANAQSDRLVASAKKQKEMVLLRTAEQDRKRTTVAANRELTMTRTFQRKDPAVFARDQIIESEIDERLQSAKVNHATESQGVDRRLSRNKLGLIEVEARKADDAIARSQKGLAALEIAAPHDGVFALKRSFLGETLRVGDTAFRGMTVADLSLVDAMEAEVFVLEAEAAGLAKGKKAEVVIDAQPGINHAAEVKQVEAVAKRRQQKSPTQYFGVILSLARTDPATMKAGQRLRARLHLHQEAALVVPRPTLFDREGKWIAYRREASGDFSPVPVKLGPSTAGLVTIVEGLKEGDVVALRDPGKGVEELVPTGSAAAGRGAR
ncbi:MAG TPA: efflux RND transporter periplasmic adaptor subunit [Polyangia bacterium]